MLGVIHLAFRNTRLDCPEQLRTLRDDLWAALNEPPAAARRFFERVTHPDKTLHEYEGTYHEPHNDLDKAQVFADIERWLEARV